MSSCTEGVPGRHAARVPSAGAARRAGAPVLVRRLAALLLGVPALMAGLHSQAAAGPDSGLAKAVEQAWRLTPRAAGTDARMSELRAAQEIASGLTPEPGAVSIKGDSDRLNGDRGLRAYEVELAVPLWLPGQQAAREAEAASRIDAAERQRVLSRLEVAADVREAWWALALARAAKMLAERRVDTARALETEVARRFRAGELSRIDANLARNEIHASEAELTEARVALDEAEQALRSLTGSSAPQTLDEEMPRSPRSEPAVDDAARSHPALLAADARFRAAETRARVAAQSRRAAPELSLRVLRERGDFGEPYGNALGLTIKIPLSSAPVVRQQESAAQAELEEAAAERSQARTRVRLGIQRAGLVVDAAERQFALAAQSSRLATDNLRLAERAFALGETDLPTLLRVRAASWDADANLERRRFARAGAVSRWNQAIGVLP